MLTLGADPERGVGSLGYRYVYGDCSTRLTANRCDCIRLRNSEQAHAENCMETTVFIKLLRKSLRKI